MFQAGATYTRHDIHGQLGGSKQACLIEARGSVVAICYQREMNPQGPRVILVGRGPQKERAAQLLATQSAAVPVFAKRRSNEWEYLGHFRAYAYTPTSEATARYVAGSGRTDVAGVLQLAPSTG